MSTRVALRSDTREDAFQPTYKEGAMVSAQALGKIQEHILNLTAYIQKKDEEYQDITAEMRGEIKSLTEDKRALVGRLGKLESDLKGSQEAQRTMQGTLQLQRAENARLRRVVEDSAAQNAQFVAQLTVTERQQRLLEKNVSRQTRQLQRSAKIADLQRKLEEKRAEKAVLEQQLRAIQANLQKQKDKIALPVAVATGVGLGVITGGFGWLLAGFAAGVAGGSAAANSPLCPCVTTLHAELSSAQHRLNLVNQEIADFEAQLNPPNA